MNTLFDMNPPATPAIPTLFDAIPQDVESITTSLTNRDRQIKGFLGAETISVLCLKITVNLYLDEGQIKSLSRCIMNVAGISDCKRDMSVATTSDSTTLLATFNPGYRDLVHKIEDIRAVIVNEDRQYVKFAQTIPVQASLF